MVFFGKKSKKKEEEEEERNANPSWLLAGGGGKPVSPDHDASGGLGGLGGGSESAPLFSAGSGGYEDDEEEDEHLGSTVGGYGTAATPPSHSRGLGLAGGGDDDKTDVSWSVEGGSVKETASTTAGTTATTGSERLASGKKPTKAYIRRAKEKLRLRRERSLAGMPRRSCCHLVFVFVNIVALVSCLCMMISQAVPLVFVKLPLLQAVLRGYLTFFCIIFCIAELELPFPFIRSSQSLHDFKSKGFLFTFISVIGIEESAAYDVAGDINTFLGQYSDGGDGSDSSSGGSDEKMELVARYFIDVSSFLMLGVGVLYMVLGLLCMKRVRDRCREDYARRMEEWFDLRSSHQQLAMPDEFLA